MSPTPKDPEGLGLSVGICLALCFCCKTSQLILMQFSLEATTKAVLSLQAVTTLFVSFTLCVTMAGHLTCLCLTFLNKESQ